MVGNVALYSFCIIQNTIFRGFSTTTSKKQNIVSGLSPDAPNTRKKNILFFFSTSTYQKKNYCDGLCGFDVNYDVTVGMMHEETLQFTLHIYFAHAHTPTNKAMASPSHTHFEKVGAAPTWTRWPSG